MVYLRQRALVVDDDALVRNLTIRALHREGFTCDAAHDGAEAMELMADRHYDVVVTDLVMPNRHGHWLASEALKATHLPLVVVLTGVLEPRLVKDLLIRGVASVEFKPTNYDLFAAKVKALCARRQSAVGSPPAVSTQKEQGAAEPPDVEQDLQRLSKVLPVSQAAFEVFNMVSSNAFDCPQIAGAIKRDAALTADVLRLANCSLYNASGNKIVDVEQAVVRIGQKRIGELALAVSTLATLTANVLPWMNTDAAWRRSMAAGVAVELLLEKSRFRHDDEALFLSAIMHSLGRIALGMLYPDRYQQMVKVCGAERRPLVEVEKQSFGMTHAEVMARLLEAWDIPDRIYLPLRHLADSYPAITGLDEPLRSKTQLLKLAVLVARVVVGRWEPWELVELPPQPVLGCLGVERLDEIIDRTAEDLAAIASMRAKSTGKRATKKTPQTTARGPIPCLCVGPNPFDFLAALLPSMGFAIEGCPADQFPVDSPGLVNCAGVSADQLAAVLDPQQDQPARVIFTDSDHPEAFEPFGQVVRLPASYGAIAAACHQVQTAPSTPA